MSYISNIALPSGEEYSLAMAAGYTTIFDGTVNGLAVRVFQPAASPNLIAVSVRGKLTADISTSGGYYELATIPNLTLDVSLVSMQIFNNTVMGQLIITTSGAVKIGYTRTIAGSTKDMTANENIWLNHIFFIPADIVQMEDNMRTLAKDFQMIRGDTLSFDVVMSGIDTSSVESLYLSAKRNRSDTEYVFQKSLSDGITLTEGRYRIRVAPEDTENIDPGRYPYDLEVTISGDVYTLMQGKINVQEDVTREGV